jgi:hypothetical protein
LHATILPACKKNGAKKIKYTLNKKRCPKGILGITSPKAKTTYLAASGAAGACSAFSALCDLCALCICLCFIGAALAVGALTASVAASGSAAKALAPKVAAKTPANNADNSLFILISFNKIKIVSKNNYLSFTSVFLALGANSFLTEAFKPVSFLTATLVVTALAGVAVEVAEAGTTAGFAASTAKAFILKLLAIKPATNTDKNLFILFSPNPYKINFSSSLWSIS